MPVFAPATDVSEVNLPEPGKYIVECIDIEDAPDKGFGPGVKWIFSLTDAQTGVQYDSDLWQFTSTKMGPKAKARPIIEGLLGRPLEVREVPDSRELIGRKMVAMVIHEPRDDGSLKATVTSCKPYVEQGATPAAAPQRAARPVPLNGASMCEQVKAAVRKASILQTHRHVEFAAMDETALSQMSDADLYDILEQINLDIQTS